MEKIIITLNENEFDKLLEYLRDVRSYYYDWCKNVKNFGDKCLIEEAERDLEDIDNLMDLLCNNSDMREPTKEERESVNKYIEDNSKDTGIKFFEDSNNGDSNETKETSNEA